MPGIATPIIVSPDGSGMGRRRFGSGAERLEGGDAMPTIVRWMLAGAVPGFGGTAGAGTPIIVLAEGGVALSARPLGVSKNPHSAQATAPCRVDVPHCGQCMAPPL